MLILLHQ